MKALLRQHKFLIWSLCVALLAVRIAGAHWHLCFDGSEPPATVHVGDGTVGHHGDHRAEHSDVDLNLVDNGLLKLLGKQLAIALALVALFTLLLQPRRSAPIPYRAKCFPAAYLHQLPPPRGPPH